MTAPAKVRGGKRPKRREAPASRPGWDGWYWIVPPIVAIVLAAPRLNLGYFWDDYYFLTFKGTGDPTLFLKPDPTAAFYRPIAQGLYTAFLRWVDPQSGVVGHWINLGLLAGTVALFARLASILAGRWAGFLAGLCLASLGVAPSLVAWVSCSQDLFAILFLLVALLLRHAGRLGLSVVAATCALLSKESALALFPVLVLWDRLVGREPARVLKPLILLGAITVAWAAVHNGMRALIGHGFQAGATGYVGLAYPGRSAFYVLRYLLTLGNIPVTGLGTPWPSELEPYAVAALVVLAVGYAIVSMSVGKRPDVPPPLGMRNLMLIAGLLLIPPILLPAFFVRHWAPYFSYGAAWGTSLLFGVLLARLRRPVAFVAAAGFLLLGVWCRGLVIPGEKVWSEAVMVDASQAIAQVKRNFLRLMPTVPKGSQLLLSVGATGMRGVTSTLLEGQAPSVWYEDPTLRSVKPEMRQSGFPHDFLFRVMDDLHIIWIDPVECRYRATTDNVEGAETSRPVRTYARAAAASGDPDLAIRIFRRLAQLDEAEFRSMDLRLAASVARDAGRQSQADSLLAEAGPLDRQAAIDLLARVFGNPTRDAELDSCAYWAFGVSPDDPEVIRYYLRIFVELGNPSQIEHFAKRLEVLQPGNVESREALRRIKEP